MQKLVTDHIFASSLDCTYKSFLQLNGHHGNKSEYEEHTEHFDSMYRIAAFANIQAQYSANRDSARGESNSTTTYTWQTLRRG